MVSGSFDPPPNSKDGARRPGLLSGVSRLTCELALWGAPGVLIGAGFSLWLGASLLLFVILGYGTLALVVSLTWPGVSPSLGWANRITLTRGSLVMALAGTLSSPEFVERYVMVALSGVILALDGLDGWVARRLKKSSPFGARFDMELDAFFVLVLCLVLVAQDIVGGWVVVIGGLRYGFVLAMLILPWLRQPLPVSLLRKTICVWQIVTLMVCLLPVVRPPLTGALLTLSLVLLLYSFGRDILLLRRGRRGRSIPCPDAARPLEDVQTKTRNIGLQDTVRDNSRRYDQKVRSKLAMIAPDPQRKRRGGSPTRCPVNAHCRPAEGYSTDASS